MYEKYPGSINDVSQLQYMTAKTKGYGYNNIGFILDRGYFSKENQKFMDENGFAFIIMVKGIKNFIHDQIRQQKGSFENDWRNQIAEFGVYGKTVHTLEKIEMCRQLDNVYRMDHAVTKTQKEILSVFGIDASHVKYKAACISSALKEGTK